jgi:hypothetical protein
LNLLTCNLMRYLTLITALLLAPLAHAQKFVTSTGGGITDTAAFRANLGVTATGSSVMSMSAPGNDMIMAWDQGGILTPVPKSSFAQIDVEGTVVNYNELAAAADFSSTETDCLYASSNAGTGVYASSVDGSALIAYSLHGTGAVAWSAGNDGLYHMIFGDPDGGNNRSAVERVRGSHVWFYGDYLGRLKTADITGNRDWTLPDASGTLALTSEVAKLAGGNTLTGEQFAGRWTSFDVDDQTTYEPRVIEMLDKGSFFTHRLVFPATLTDDEVINIPNDSGTLALTSDITSAVATETSAREAADATLTTAVSGKIDSAFLNAWAGSANITTLGTIASGTVPVARISGTLTEANGGNGTTTGISAATQTALDLKKNKGSLELEMRDTAGQVPYRLPALESPYQDRHAEAVIAAATVTDDRGKEHYRRLISGLKAIGAWDALENGYLLGSSHNASSATIYSITGNNTATGTSTFSDTHATFNGTSDKYTFTNRTPTTAAAGVTFVAFHKADQTTTGIKSLVSNYAPSPSRGFTMNLGTGFAGGEDNLVALGSYDGAADININNIAVDLASDSQWSFSAVSVLSGAYSIIGNSRQPNQNALTPGKLTVWNNNANYIMGATTTGAQFYKGDAVFFGVWNAGLTNAQLFAVKLLLESVFSDAFTLEGGIVFDGNSLTAAATGGGTTWPAQLLALPAWSGVTRSDNIALSGALQTKRGENNYFTNARRWIPIAGQTVHYVVWSGVNDCTALVPSATIIASLQRHIRRAKAEGFDVTIMTLTPVDGYGWGGSHQAIRTAVNAWILTANTTEGVRVIDLNEISVANPDFGTPALTTYYTDGLHHNDAGRALIAAKVAAELTPP